MEVGPLLIALLARLYITSKILRPRGHAKNIRILFIFDPEQQAILLVAGDKTGQWNKWYKQNIPLAEKRYEEYLRKRHDNS
ncbi:type II toxin-antitoxin system RelE/ParE family toxin [Rothia nasisuis]|uniref:type II toxin-antitoxin system RelE/ParE family toxin n=1 Tax=Rothia nasisuis TaxID=2109647 RepID=UPI003AFA84DA